MITNVLVALVLSTLCYCLLLNTSLVFDPHHITFRINNFILCVHRLWNNILPFINKRHFRINFNYHSNQPHAG
ncbi:uncharacterized protein RJT21DRAFT_119226 [Scheffersomyces amazonensis]|uniref:uncharacterized protein n=1 Tax=Scheffersomyces amazonensis TaxID=1078765 RepID=UPI00315DD2D1